MTNLLDIRTIMVSYVISNLICALVIFSLWLQNKKRSPGIGYWLADFILQFIGVVFITLRGSIPDFVSIVIGNASSIFGTYLLFVGLEKYVGKASRQIHNYIFLLIYFILLIFFTYSQPSLLARNINFSVCLLLLCIQSAWLLLVRVNADMKSSALRPGIIFLTYAFVNLLRIIIDINTTPASDFFHSSMYDTLIILIYQMLFIGLTFSLFLMVNGQLVNKLEKELDEKAIVENELKKSNEKFVSAFHSIPDAVVLTEISTGKLIDVNDTFFRITGYDPEEIIGKTTFDLNVWGDIKDRQAYVDLVRKNEKILSFETVFRKKSGELFPGSISGETILVNDSLLALSVIRDMTAQKQAESEIRRIASFPRLNPNPVLEVDNHGIVIYANQSAHTVLASLGLTDLNVFIPKDVGVIIEAAQQRKKISLSRELSLGGREFLETIHYVSEQDTLHIYVTDITERKTNEIRAQKAMEDVKRLLEETQRSRRTLLSVVEDQKEAEERIRLLNQELEERVRLRTAQLENSNKELEAFAYSVSHDLRAPLRAIDGFSRILEQEYSQAIDDEGKRLIGVIRDNTNKMDHLIIDLLSLSRISRSELNYSMIDMTTLVKTAFKDICPPEYEDKIKFSIKALPKASGDPTLIRQVWNNLISNAIKYSHARDEIIIEVSGHHEGGQCTYSIKDNGVGFNPRYMDKLFGLFQRLHKASDFEGTGVGLAIVKRIIDRHNGKVWAESEVDHGATFYLMLPKGK